MDILTQTREFNREEKYNLYIKGGKLIKDLPVGTELEVVGYTVYEDKNSKGDDVVITAMLLADGSVVSTSSATVLRELENIVTGLCIVFEKETLKIKTARGVSKNGREYNTVEYAG